ncbi:MarR family winged helix-turn-helix transcriptional regulator [Polaromonas sp. YR568]|uniref:MarR family winged helix-turn-helix transcriptional regulator n=1 Tax=Polaromonas sp. YR568 TaxID=1855301 RepID=UPI00398BFCBB
MSKTLVKPQARNATRNDPAAEALRRFRLIFNAVKTHFREVEKKAGLAGAQLWALSVVRGTPGIGVSELASEMDVHQSTASNLLKSLVTGGLVEVERSSTDRRALALRVSPAGLKVLKRAPGPFSGVLPEALASLDTPALIRLNRDLDKVIQALGVDKRAANIPLGQPDT